MLFRSVERPDAYLPKAPIIRPVVASRGGVVQDIDTRAVGLAVVTLGGGRSRPQDQVDHAVGFSALRPCGDRVQGGEALAVAHARSEVEFDRAAAAIVAAYKLGDAQPDASVLIERLPAEA
mgnify:CR=1 FL=1